MEEIIKAIQNNRQQVGDNILKSFDNNFIEKSVAAVGEIRRWKDGDYKKISPGKWSKLESNKEKKVSNTAIVKLINSEIQKLNADLHAKREDFVQNLDNPHKPFTYQYHDYIQLAWSDQIQKDKFVAKLLKERNDLQDELTEIENIAYQEKKQKREEKIGKHEIDEHEIEDIVKKYRSLFNKIDNDMPMNVSAIELMPIVTIDDYYLDTETNFVSVLNLKSYLDIQSQLSVYRKLDSMWEDMKNSGKYTFKKSPKSSSEYLIDETNGDIYRYSDHWGRVASCRWKLDDDLNVLAIAKSNVKNFKRRKDSTSIYFNPKHKDAVVKTIKTTFPQIKKLLQENEKFYLTKNSEKILVNFAKNLFNKYVKVLYFEEKEIEKLTKKFSEFI